MCQGLKIYPLRRSKWFSQKAHAYIHNSYIKHYLNFFSNFQIHNFEKSNNNPINFVEKKSTCDILISLTRSILTYTNSAHNNIVRFKMHRITFKHHYYNLNKRKKIINVKRSWAKENYYNINKKITWHFLATI